MRDILLIAVLFVICFTAAALGEAVGKLIFGLVKGYYYRITGFRPLCLDETVALAVSRQYASKFEFKGGSISKVVIDVADDA